MPKTAHHIHDTFFKKLMSSDKFARELMSAHLPEDLKRSCDLKRLDLLNQSFVSDDDKALLADAVFRIKLKGERLAYVTVLVEHQRKAERAMPFRILKYLIQVMDYHYRHCKRLPLVYPILFYNGAKSYPYSMDIRTLVDAPKALVDRYFLQPAKLIDLSQPAFASTHQHALVNLMQLCMSHRATCVEVARHLEGMFSQLDDAEFRSVLNYVAKTKIYSREEFEQIKAAGYIGGEMTSYFEKLLAEKEQTGRKEVMEDIIINMLKQSKDYKEIAKWSGISVTQIREIANRQSDLGSRSTK